MKSVVRGEYRSSGNREDVLHVLMNTEIEGAILFSEFWRNDCLRAIAEVGPLTRFTSVNEKERLTTQWLRALVRARNRIHRSHLPWGKYNAT